MGIRTNICATHEEKINVSIDLDDVMKILPDVFDIPDLQNIVIKDNEIYASREEWYGCHSDVVFTKLNLDKDTRNRILAFKLLSDYYNRQKAEALAFDEVQLNH